MTLVSRSVLLANLIVVSGLLSGCASPGSIPLKFVETSGAPRSPAHFSQGVIANGFLFTAGFTPRDPVSGASAVGMTAQANRVLDNLEAVLRDAGCSWKDVVKMTVYLADMDEFSRMDAVMSARLGTHKPARTTFQPARMPGGAALYVDLIARVP